MPGLGPSSCHGIFVCNELEFFVCNELEFFVCNELEFKKKRNVSPGMVIYGNHEVEKTTMDKRGNMLRV